MMVCLGLRPTDFASVARMFDSDLIGLGPRLFFVGLGGRVA